MRNFLMSAIALCAFAVMMNGCDDTSINPPPSKEGDVYYNYYAPESKIWSLYQISADGTGKYKIADNAMIFGHSFKNKIAYTKIVGSSSEIIIANTDGTQSKSLATINEPLTRSLLSPTGMKVLYQYDNYSNDGKAHIHTVNIDGTSDINIITDASPYDTPVFSPNGSRIAFTKRGAPDGSGMRTDSLFSVNIDGSNRTFLAAGDKYLNDGLNSPLWSHDGTKIVCVTKETHNELMVVDVENKSILKIGGNNTAKGFLNWSPDSKKILYTQYSPSTGAALLSTINSDGTGQRDIIVSDDFAPPVLPQWSSDGNSILFTEFTKENSNVLFGPLKIMNINTSQIITLDESASAGYWKK